MSLSGPGGPRSAKRRRRPSSSRHPDARVDQREEDVGEQRADDGEERVDQQDAAGEVHVLVDQRAQQQRADVGQVHHRGHDQAAREQHRQVPADGADQRVEGEPHRIAQHQAPFLHALGARRHDVGLVELVQKVGAHDAAQAGGAGDAQHQRRQPEMGEKVPQLGPAPRRVGVLGRIEAGDADVEIGEGDPHQDQRQHEVGRGDADIVDDGEDVVADRARMGRRIDAGRDGDRPGEEEGEQGERQREADLLADEVGVGPLVLQRQAEIALHQVLHPQEVLHDHRLVEPVLGAPCLDLLLRDRRARRGQRGDIRRQEVARRRLDDDEDDEGVDHHQQRQERQPLQDVTGHGYATLMHHDPPPSYGGG